MNAPNLFDAGPPAPKNDAAPTAIGAGANGQATPDKFTRLPLIPPAHHNAPGGTSSVAATRIASAARTLRDRVYAFIASRGAHGATDDEGETALAIKCQTYTPRRNELARMGLVVDTGRRRNTASGRPAAVWIASEHATRPEGGAQ